MTDRARAIGAELVASDEQAAATNAALEREDWPVHQPAAPDAPIPGRRWYSGCEPADYDAERGHHGPGPRVRPDGVCEGCGEKACPACGAGLYPDGGCRCPEVAVCAKCGTLLDDDGLCGDETCPYSDRPQGVPYTEG